MLDRYVDEASNDERDRQRGYGVSWSR